MTVNYTKDDCGIMQRSRAANEVHDIKIITVMLYHCMTRQNIVALAFSVRFVGTKSC